MAWIYVDSVRAKHVLYFLQKTSEPHINDMVSRVKLGHGKRHFSVITQIDENKHSGETFYIARKFQLSLGNRFFKIQAEKFLKYDWYRPRPYARNKCEVRLTCFPNLATTKISVFENNVDIFNVQI